MPKSKDNFGHSSYYSLSDVKNKISSNKVNIKPNARERAYKDFGWGMKEILDVYSKLKTIHYYKSEPSNCKFPQWLDFYKARFNGEDIYTHFYIDDENGYLIINSFHRE